MKKLFCFLVVVAAFGSIAAAATAPYLERFENGSSIPPDFRITVTPPPTGGTGDGHFTVPAAALRVFVEAATDGSTTINAGAVTSASAAVLFSPGIAGSDFTVSTKIVVGPISSTGDSSSAPVGIGVLGTAQDLFAGSAYQLVFQPMGNFRGRLVLRKLGTGSGSLTGTRASAERITYSPGLTGTMTLTATYAGQTITIEGKFESGGTTLTVTGTDDAPSGGAHFGLVAQAIPFNVNEISGPPQSFAVRATADFDDFEVGTGGESVLARDDDLVIRSASATELFVLKNDLATNGRPLRVNSVTPASKGRVVLQRGRVYYTPGDAFYGTDTFTYTAAAGDAFSSPAQVTVRNPFLAWRGPYYQIVRDSSDTAAGTVSAKVTSGGALTGTLRLRGRSFPLVGRVDPEGDFSQTIERRGKPDLEVSLTFATANNTATFSGAITGSEAFTIAETVVGSTTLPTNVAEGGYTVRVNPDPSNSNAPRGFGWARLIVSGSGRLAFSGRLGDDTPFTATSRLDVNQAAQFYVSLYAGPKGEIAGTIQFHDGQSPQADGVLAWRKPPQKPPTGLYPGGFEASVDLIASKYAAPAQGERALAYSNPIDARASIVLGEGASPLTTDVSVSAADVIRATPPNALKLRLEVNRATGLFEGQFVPAPGESPLVFRGALIQSDNAGVGVFRANAAASPMTFLPE